MAFQDNLAPLPTTDGITALELLNAAGEAVVRLENRPGTAGSVRVYNALFARFGSINREAAQAGIELYAEHTADARANPGKHPNIDRLFEIAEQGAAPLAVRLIKE